jgi:DegV family protein with EDD domain
VFYEKLARAKKLPTTSQVTPGLYLEVFQDAEAKGDEVLVVAISSGISGTYSSAVMAKEMSGYEGVTLVDSHHCFTTQRMLAEHAVKLRDEGQSRAAIAEALESLRDRLVLLVMLDTMKNLRKGGRVPPALAIVGELLHIKPVLIVRGGKIEALGKVRGFEAGKKALWKKFEEDGCDETWPVYFGFSYDKARGEQFMQETIAKYGLGECSMYPVGGVIGTHAGPGGIAIAYMKKAK